MKEETDMGVLILTREQVKEVIDMKEVLEKVREVYQLKSKGESVIWPLVNYEFKKDNGVLVVTADGKKNNGKITRVSMSYNDTNGPTYKAVKNIVGSNAVTREHYNNVTGNFGYVQDNDLSYQFSSSSPSDKNIKLYRIDLTES